jgi:hypothetical protein
MLEATGFQVLAKEETEDWERLQREVYRRWLESREALTKELGERVAQMLVEEARWHTAKNEDRKDELSRVRRVIMVARRDADRP